MKKCAVINDLSGFGKCSLSAAIPIISCMGSEVHAMPTAVLSNQTAYDSYKCVSMTEHMASFSDEWQKLGVHFDAILTGFVSDEAQLDLIFDFIRRFKESGTLLIVDPVMADNGKLYPCYNAAMCEKIKKLCFEADIITPNLSELSLLADEEYSEDLRCIKRYCKKVADIYRVNRIAVTGYKENNFIYNIIYENGEIKLTGAKQYKGYFSGTGDIFASVITGGILRGDSLYDCASLASRFISDCAVHTESSDGNDGVDFERFLGELI